MCFCYKHFKHTIAPEIIQWNEKRKENKLKLRERKNLLLYTKCISCISTPRVRYPICLDAGHSQEEIDRSIFLSPTINIIKKKKIGKTSEYGSFPSLHTQKNENNGHIHKPLYVCVCVCIVLYANNISISTFLCYISIINCVDLSSGEWQRHLCFSFLMKWVRNQGIVQNVSILMWSRIFHQVKLFLWSSIFFDFFIYKVTTWFIH